MRFGNMKRNEKDVCRSKSKFESENIVFGTIKFNQMEGSQEPYFCDVCQKWHIRTIDKTKREKRIFKKYKKQRRK